MGRRKVQIKRIENKSSRQVTFCKRRNGLIEKARQLSVLCESSVAVLVVSAIGKLYNSSSGDNMSKIIDRYKIQQADDLQTLGYIGVIQTAKRCLYWTSELLNIWETIGTWVYRSSQAKESLIRSPVLRYATRLIGSLLYGTTTAASVTQWELCLLYQGVRHLLPAFGNSTFPPATAFNMGAVLAANLAGYKGKVTKSKSNACGFGAVITRILTHVGVDCENHQVALDRSNNIAWNYLDVISLVSKEFIAGPHSRIDRDGPYVYVFQDRAKKTLYCHLPQIGLTALLSEAAVEFLPPATALVDRPSFFTPKYQTKGKAVVDEEGEDEAAQAIPDDSQPHQLLPSDSSQYKLQELPPNATSRQQQHWRDQSIKTNNDMLHKIWAAISRIRPCRCQKDDVVHRDNSPSSSGSGSSGTHRVRKRSKRPTDAGTSGAGDEE
ncbi:hypothetical protein YC2023_040287 [Brassica napus]